MDEKKKICKQQHTKKSQSIERKRNNLYMYCIERVSVCVCAAFSSAFRTDYAFHIIEIIFAILLNFFCCWSALSLSLIFYYRIIYAALLMMIEREGKIIVIYI